LTKPGKTREERRIKIRKRRAAIKESFETFVWPTVERDLPFLKQVWVIGREVGEALKNSHFEGMPNEISERWIISQPNGQNQDQYLRDLKKLVRGISICR
jgi:hypothetical protein